MTRTALAIPALLALVMPAAAQSPAPAPQPPIPTTVQRSALARLPRRHGRGRAGESMVDGLPARRRHARHRASRAAPHRPQGQAAARPGRRRAAGARRRTGRAARRRAASDLRDEPAALPQLREAERGHDAGHHGGRARAVRERPAHRTCRRSSRRRSGRAGRGHHGSGSPSTATDSCSSRSATGRRRRPATSRHTRRRTSRTTSARSSACTTTAAFPQTIRSSVAPARCRRSGATVTATCRASRSTPRRARCGRPSMGRKAATSST